MKRLFLLLFCGCLLSITAFSQTLEERYLFHDDLIREYLIYVPSTYDVGVAAPLVLVMHGFGSNKENMLGVGMNDFAETTGYIVAYPDGVIGAFGSAWNNGMILNTDIDDMGFLNALMDTIINTYNINERRIYSTGFSMGGVMSHRLGCESGNRMAAIASMSGPLAMSIRDNCVPQRKMPMLHLQGTSDDVLAYWGSALTATTGAMNTFHTWANHNECEGEVIIEQVPDTADEEYHVERYTYSDCDENYEVVHYRIYDWPHSWPRSRFNINATKEMVDFFERHEIPDEQVVLDAEDVIATEALRPGPNPFHNHIDLHLLQADSIDPRWFIYSADGRLMKQGSSTDRLDTSEWPNGLYIIRVIDDVDGYSYQLLRQ